MNKKNMPFVVDMTPEIDEYEKDEPNIYNTGHPHFQSISNNLWHNTKDPSEFDDDHEGHAFANEGEDKLIPRTFGPMLRLANGSFSKQIDHKYYDWVEKHDYHTRDQINLKPLMKETIDYHKKIGNFNTSNKVKTLHENLMKKLDKSKGYRDAEDIIARHTGRLTDAILQHHPHKNWFKNMTDDKEEDYLQFSYEDED